MKGFGKVKIGKFLDGTIRLTEEEDKIYSRNLKLVTLSKDYDETEYVTKQLKNSSFKSDFTGFISLCEKYYFKNIVNHDQKWFTTFFEKNRLLDILS